MPDLTPRPTPPTSPPAVPLPPDRNLLPPNSPRRGLRAPEATPYLTPEEIAAANEEELAAQQQDMVDALAEEEESNTAMAALEGVFVPSGIFRHRGIGPLQYETRRGLLKVFSGDLVCHLAMPTNPEAPPEEQVFEDEFIAVSELTLSGLLFSVEPRLFPENINVRAQRIGNERREAAAEIPPEEPPATLSRKQGESDSDFQKRQDEATKDRRKKLDERNKKIEAKRLENRKKLEAERKKRPTQLPADRKASPPESVRPPQSPLPEHDPRKTPATKPA